MTCTPVDMETQYFSSYKFSYKLQLVIVTRLFGGQNYRQRHAVFNYRRSALSICDVATKRTKTRVSQKLSNFELLMAVRCLIGFSLCDSRAQRSFLEKWSLDSWCRIC